MAVTCVETVALEDLIRAPPDLLKLYNVNGTLIYLTPKGLFAKIAGEVIPIFTEELTMCYYDDFFAVGSKAGMFVLFVDDEGNTKMFPLTKHRKYTITSISGGDGELEYTAQKGEKTVRAKGFFKKGKFCY